ncbi:hypothetical protein [Wolbachia endosymbiont of Trichogramma pretiosum]|uniref:hypothetical protein n=1 Tax=Wolbachia endosymbiont of Trichogramma pretiosum TaxID=125593 RepID=UPI0012EDB86A|nr:hypothetical protein [Wolbachia endosymbiont of Trichogramma pretiosum]
METTLQNRIDTFGERFDVKMYLSILFCHPAKRTQKITSAYFKSDDNDNHRYF